MSPAKFIDDPGWFEFLPEFREPAKKRHLPTHEDCQPIDAEDAAAHIMAGGTLGSMPLYEERPGQIEMLKSVARAFNAREHLMVEAGTGVGKSLAYLIPAILWAWRNDTPVIISTATRNLQSQLINSDIPKAVSILGERAADFKVALLKGRGNYLCLRALSEFFAGGFWSMDEADQREIPRFIEWLQTTPDGDLDLYDGLPRSLLTCPGEECSGRHCPFFSRCFVFKARKNAADAHLVIVNHALVLAESASAGAILPAYGRLVLDEAHNLEDIATEHLSCEFSMPALTRILNRLSRKGRGKRAYASGILASVERQLQKGALAASPASGEIAALVASAPALAAAVRLSTEATLAQAERLFAPLPRSAAKARYRFLEGRRQFSQSRLFTDYSADQWSEADLFSAQTRMESDLAALSNMLTRLKAALDGSAKEGEFNFFADLATQVAGAAESIVEFMNEACFVLGGEKDSHTYWIEKVRQERRHPYTRLVAAPLSVADELGEMIWKVKDSAILSSATLRVGNDFKYMARRLGATDAARFRTFVATSPFNYLRQSLVLGADFLPMPATEGAGEYAAALAEILRGVFAATGGRGLALFTSYEMMEAVARLVREPLADAGIRLLVQGEGLSREAMTAELKRAGAIAGAEGGAEGCAAKVPRSGAGSGAEGGAAKVPSAGAGVVLFGSQSFWEGVDVAGDALSCVVIARLPFAQVGDPVVEARSEKIEREGGSSFRDYTLPEAVIKFRQGFGRLIRSKRDRGVVVVADPRIVTKNYGATFRNSIPASVHTVTSASELLGRIREWFTPTA